MAATGKTPILLYGSTTPTNQPSAGNLTNSSDGCEIAINVADKNLFFKDATNTVNTVPIRQSSTSSNGWLSSTDWNTFNNKQPAGTYVTSVTGTAPVVSSGGTTPAISMAAATSSVNGYLTSTDWSTFNGKQTALVSGTNIKTVNGTTLLGSGDLGTIGTGYGGTGLTSFTSGGVLYASSTSALTTGSILNFDGSNVLTLGTASQSYAQYIVNSSGNSQVRLHINGSFKGGMYSTGTGITVASNSQINFSNDSGATAGMSLDASSNLNLAVGNLVIGTSGKGIDFSATAGTGTSELLADYEEGTWTPTDASGAGLTFDVASARYIKVGNVVNIWLRVKYPATANASAAQIGGLPFTSVTFLPTGLDVSGGVTVMLASTTSCMGTVNYSSTTIGSLQTFTAPATSITNATFSGQNIYLFGTYHSAS